MEPVSTTIVTALALGAAAGLKPTAEQFVKDAYNGLKDMIKSKYRHVNFELLESDPASKSRQSVVSEDLEKTDAVRDEEILQKVKHLLEAIRAGAPQAMAAIGVDLEDVKGASLRIGDIISSGTGVKVKHSEFSYDIEI